MGTLKAEDVGRKQNCLWLRSPQSLVALIYTCSFAHGSSQTSEPCSLPLTKPHTVSFTHSVIHSFSILRSFFLSDYSIYVREADLRLFTEHLIILKINERLHRENYKVFLE